MKLASYQDGSRDGQLVVVSRDGNMAHLASGIASRLQQVLDDWNFLSPQLEDLSTTLNQGKARHAFAFEPRRCMAPLPRAFQWVDASAYPSHAQRVALARGVALAADFADDWVARPRLYQGGSDDFLGPCQDAWFDDPAWGIDIEAELVVATGDVPMGASAEQGLDSVRLLLLANDWSLRGLIPDELAKGFGFLQGKPATAFAPMAVTPDELGPTWQQGRVHLPVQVAINGRPLGRVEAGQGMALHFGQLIAHLARTRRVRAGSLIGGGTVSHPEAAQGCACLIEQRACEQHADGQPRTPWLQVGDRVRIDVTGRDGHSVFGAIDQAVAGPAVPSPAASDTTGLPGEAAGDAPA